MTHSKTKNKKRYRYAVVITSKDGKPGVMVDDRSTAEWIASNAESAGEVGLIHEVDYDEWKKRGAQPILDELKKVTKEDLERYWERKRKMLQLRSRMDGICDDINALMKDETGMLSIKDTCVLRDVYRSMRVNIDNVDRQRMKGKYR